MAKTATEPKTTAVVSARLTSIKFLREKNDQGKHKAQLVGGNLKEVTEQLEKDWRKLNPSIKVKDVYGVKVGDDTEYENTYGNDFLMLTNPTEIKFIDRIQRDPETQKLSKVFGDGEDFYCGTNCKASINVFYAPKYQTLQFGINEIMMTEGGDLIAASGVAADEFGEECVTDAPADDEFVAE